MGLMIVFIVLYVHDWFADRSVDKILAKRQEERDEKQRIEWAQLEELEDAARNARNAKRRANYAKRK